MGKKAAPKSAPSPIPAEAEEPAEEEKPEEVVGELLEGDFIFPDGSNYQGQYLKAGKNLVLHGTGSLRSGPELYHGTFEKGLYKVGRFTSCTGATYEGYFRDNQFHGLGHYTWPDGRSYRGMWKDGEMHGPGEFVKFACEQKPFTGISLGGRFHSAESKDAGQAYLAEYATECREAACAALCDLAKRATSSGPPRQFICPPRTTSAIGSVEEEPGDVSEDRVLVDSALSGPTPEATAVLKEATRAFVAGLAEDAAQPLVVRVYEEDQELPGQRLEKQRLKLPQLQYSGQAVEFSLPAGEAPQAGTLVAMALVNVSRDYDFAKARWKIAYIDVVPPEATE